MAATTSARRHGPCSCHLACLTVPIPSGCDRAEPVGTHIVRLSPSPDVSSATTADLDAPGAAAESGFGESTVRYSHADWARENRPSLRATPPCGTSLLTGRQPYRTTFCRVPLLTSAPPSRRSSSLLAKVGYTPPTTAPSCSSANRPRNHIPTCSARWDAWLVC